MQISLKMNQSRLMENLKLAFSNRFTIISELIQNARRAGANSVSIGHDHENKTLTITDNGCGIEDFQALLSIAESGWDNEIREKDSPYGMGFLSALFAATSIRILSRGKACTLDCQQVRAGQGASVEKSSEAPAEGAVIVLEGVEMYPYELQRHLEKLVLGFPIDVQLNGQSLSRPYALDSGRTFVDTAIGQVSVLGIHDGKEGIEGNYNKVIFLQGIQVDGPNCPMSDATIVHLDSTKFMGRVPDRENLIDHGEKIKEAHDFISGLWKELLWKRVAEMPAKDFLDTFENVLKYDYAVLNKLDLLPRTMLQEIAGYPKCHLDGTEIQQVREHVSKADVVSGKVSLFEPLDDIGYEGEDSERWMYVYQIGGMFISRHHLPNGHWAYSHILDLYKDNRGEDRPVSVSPVNIVKTGSFSGGWVAGNVILCEKYSIEISGLEPVFIHRDGIYAEDGFVIPAQESGGRVVHQASNYSGESDEYFSGDYFQDRQDLAQYISHLRCTDPAKILKELLSKVPSLGQVDTLLGKRFSVEINSEGLPEVSMAA